MTDQSDITEGLDGSLFLTGGSNDVLRYYVDETYFGLETRVAWQELLLDRADKAAARGIKYFHLAPPEKLTVYQDKFPVSLPYPNGAPSTSLVASFEGHPREATLREVFVDVIPFFEHQKTGGVQLYWKTDTHWTFEGAYSAYQVLCHRIGTEQASVVLQVPDASGELVLDLGGKLSPPRTELFRSKQLPLHARRTEANELVYYKELNQLEGEGGLHVGSRVVFSNNEAPDHRTIVLFGDSFSEYRPILLTGIIAETFAETHFLWSSQVDWDYVDRVKPDILVTELAERFMNYVPVGDVDVDALAAEKVLNHKQNSISD
jgi:alginate O-acetyltransferase complex protein AlgJ